MNKTFKTIGKVTFVFVILTIVFLVYLYVQKNSWKEDFQSNNGNEDIIEIAEELPCNISENTILCLTNSDIEKFINSVKKHNTAPITNYEIMVYKENKGWNEWEGYSYYDFNRNEVTKEICDSKVNNFTVVKQSFTAEFYFMDDVYKSGGLMSFNRSVLFDSEKKPVCQSFWSLKNESINVH